MQRDKALAILAKHHEEIQALGVKSLALFLKAQMQHILASTE